MTTCISVNPPAICSFAFRFKRRAYDFEIEFVTWSCGVSANPVSKVTRNDKYAAAKVGQPGVVFFLTLLDVVLDA